MPFAKSMKALLLVVVSMPIVSIELASGQDLQNGVDTIIRNQNLNSNPNRESSYDRFAVSGKKTRLGYYYAVKLNCQPEDWNEVSISKQPEHGNATLRDGTTVMSYGKDNVRSSCNGKSIKAKMLEYVPSQDYKGADEIVVESINSAGQQIISTFKVTVK
jgi:hypothetical protein